MSIFGFRLYFQSLIGTNFWGISLIVLCFALVILCALTLFGPARFPFKSSQPAILKVLRFSALAVFFFFVVLDPVFVKISNDKNLRLQKPSLALVMDFTRSMSITGRMEDSIRWFERRVKYLEENFDIRIFAFGIAPSYEDYVREFKTKEEAEKFFKDIKNRYLLRGVDGEIPVGANRTDISLALSRIAGKYGKGGGGQDAAVKHGKNFNIMDNQRPLDGILLISDGVNTQKEVEEIKNFISVEHNEEDSAISTGGPYSPFVFAGDVFQEKNRKPPDISIISCDVPDYAFKGMKIPVSLKVKKTSGAGHIATDPLTKVVVKVRSSDNQPGISKSSSIKKSAGDITASPSDIAVVEKEIPEGISDIKFDIPPVDRIGHLYYTVTVSTFSWEVSHKNNRRDFSVEILRDKIRVLYLCGRPSYEYSFLRDFIKNDLAFELVTFVILRNPEDVVLVPDEELSLIPFPGADLIVKQLKDFDVVIFENFTYNRFGIYPQHLEMVKRWVDLGGGFLMIAGENSFRKGGYGGTAISQILPVIIEDTNGGKGFVSGRFNPVIVRRQGEEANDFIHQWFSLMNQISDASGRYDNKGRPQGGGMDFSGNISVGYLPPLEGIEVLNPRPDAFIALAHPWLKVDKNISAPVLALMDYGKGRTGALLTNSTWRWKINPQAPAGLYESFWKSVINYLAYSSRSEDTGKIRVIGFKNKIGKDEDFNFIVKKRYPTSIVSVILTAPDGSKKLLEPLSDISQPGQAASSVKNLFKAGNNYVMFSLPYNKSGNRSAAAAFSHQEGRYLFEITDEAPLAGKNLPRIQKETLQMTVSAVAGYQDDASNIREISHLDVDEDYLKLISGGSGGFYFRDDLSSEGVGTFPSFIGDMKRVLSRRLQPDRFYPGEDVSDYSGNIEGARSGVRGRKNGHLIVWMWRPSKDLWFIILVVASIITAELILRRKRYGLW